MKNVVVNVARGFSGGPELSRVSTFRFPLADRNLEVSVPEGGVISPPQERNINFPYRAEGWFDANKKQNMHDIYVSLGTWLWYYFPAMRLGPHPELGELYLSVWLKQTPETISALDLDHLSSHVIQVYDDHYNSETIAPPGQHGKGTNTRIRNDVYGELVNTERSAESELVQDMLRASIESQGYPPLEPAKIVTVSGIDYVFFRECRPEHRSLSHKDSFCYPLDHQYYLQIQFSHVIYASEKKSWQKHADLAQDQIISSVKIT